MIVLCGFAGAGPAAASTFNISPIRADLSPGHRTDVLTLMNGEDQPVVVEVRGVAWSQEDGEERLVETRDLLVTPPVAQIPANGAQMVRVALRREPDAACELTYRIILEEVPQAAPPGFTGLKVALRLSVPVFVAPAHGGAKSHVIWAMRPLDGEELELAATNLGTAHARVTDLDVALTGGQTWLSGMTPKYVLPGSRVIWHLKADRATAIQAGGLIVHGHGDEGEFTADVAISGL